jgi:fumarate hydratase subunit beta
MDAYAPALLARGLRGMIGKGERTDAVIAAMGDAGAVYFGAIGGAGALLAGYVEKNEPVAFADLGPEAIHRLFVRDFPVTVVVDTSGENLYRTGPKRFLEFAGDLSAQ